MKTIFTFFVIALIAFSFTGCKSDQEKLETDIYNIVPEGTKFNITEFIYQISNQQPIDGYAASGANALRVSINRGGGYINFQISQLKPNQSDFINFTNFGLYMKDFNRVGSTFESPFVLADAKSNAKVQVILEDFGSYTKFTLNLVGLGSSSNYKSRIVFQSY